MVLPACRLASPTQPSTISRRNAALHDAGASHSKKLVPLAHARHGNWDHAHGARFGPLRALEANRATVAGLRLLWPRRYSGPVDPKATFASSFLIRTVLRTPLAGSSELSPAGFAVPRNPGPVLPMAEPMQDFVWPAGRDRPDQSGLKDQRR
jgi:hypothetical protein